MPKSTKRIGGIDVERFKRDRYNGHCAAPKSFADALVMGFREANEGCTHDECVSHDLTRMVGTFPFLRGIRGLNADDSRMLLIPFTATIQLGKPYYEKKKRDKKTPKPGAEGGGAA